MYQILLAPAKQHLAEAKINTLLFVPDRSLRVLPLAALYDGEHYVAQSYQVLTLPSLDLTASAKSEPVRENNQQLLAGLSLPDGPLINKLPVKFSQVLERSVTRERDASIIDPNELLTMKIKKLSLPGVTNEIARIGTLPNSKTILNKEFTTEEFTRDLTSGEYSRVHIASHGVFGNNAKESYIMAYDNVVTLLDLQKELGKQTIKEHPLDLITLSACETAEGNDRFLLGFSGMAIRSNVLSAIGSLWPINDEGAYQFMGFFYDALNQHKTKIQAFQQAQKDMINSERYGNPIYWSPFIMTGMW